MKTTFKKAKYRQCTIPVHNDNYLITALPEKFTQKQLKNCLSLNLQAPIMAMSKDDKVSSIRQVKKKLFIPNREHIKLYEYLYGLITLGYENRNPIEPSVIEWTFDIADPDIPLNIENDSDTISEGSTMIGKTGLGKSTIMNRILFTCFPTIITHHEDDFDDIQIVYLKIDMPHDGSRGGICKAIFKAFDKTLKKFEDNNYYKMYASPEKSRSPSIDVMEENIHILLRKYHVGILVIDELQNLLVEGKINRNKTLQFFDSLVNNAEVPVVRIGTSDSLNLFNKNHRHIRRAGPSVFEAKPYAKDDKYWGNIIDELIKYQFAPKPLIRTEAIDNLLYDLTRGYPYALIALWQQIQIYIVTIAKNDKPITESKIRNIWKQKFPLVSRVFKAITNNRTGKLDDMLDAQHFLEVGNIEQALKHIEHALNHSDLKGPAAQAVSSALTDIEKDVHSPEQIEKIKSIRAKADKRIGNIKAGQTYEHKGDK